MADRKFATLRKRLDQFGYRQPLGIESVPLVEKLFSDLVHTTESFKNYKQKKQQHDKEISMMDHSEPYRNENARLVQENNELHFKLLKFQEESSSVLAELKASIKKLQTENEDLVFLNSQYIHNIRTLEKESNHKSNHIEKLLDKNNAGVSSPNGRKKAKIPFRRQRIDMNGDFPMKEDSLPSSSIHYTTDPYVADLLSLADTNNAEMKHFVDELQIEKDQMQRKNTSLQKQVDSRDKEIARLNGALEGGRPVEAVLKDNYHGNNDRVVSHLNIQVDYLQQVNQEMEKQLLQNQTTQGDATRTIKSLTNRNNELCMELAALNKICKNIDREKDFDHKDVGQQLVTLHKELEEKCNALTEMQSNTRELKKSRKTLLDENEQLSRTIQQTQRDKENIAELLIHSEKEKKRLTEKNAKLTVSERDLAMNIERLKISKGIVSQKTQSLDQVRMMVKNIEDDRDHFKKECETLQNIIHQKIFTTMIPVQQPHTNEQNVSLKEELDFYKQECERFRLNSQLSPTSHKQLEAKELAKVRRERDDLQRTLQHFDKQLAEIQEDVTMVTTQRDNIQLLYEQSVEELQGVRRQLSRVSATSTTSLKINNIIEKAEKERDEAINELRRARMDVQSLRNDVKLAEEDHMTRKQQQNNQRRSVDDLIAKLESDNDQLNIRVASTQSMVHTLESQLNSANASVRQYSNELAEKESQLTKLKLLLENSERTCGELNRKMAHTSQEVRNENEEKQMLKNKCDRSEELASETRKEISRLKGVIMRLDKERDGLQQQVDEKAENLVRLDSNLRKHEEEDNLLKLSVEELEERLKHHEQQLISKDREVNSLSKQLRSTEEELAGVTKSRNVTVRENRQLQDDLTTMTNENQSVHEDLQNVLNEVDMLKEEIAEYATQLSRIQQLLLQKEDEKEDLLLQYKTLSNKAGMLENNAQQSEDESEVFKQDLILYKQELMFVKGQCVVLEQEVEQHISTEEAYEKQLAEMNKVLTLKDEQLVLCKEEKESILQDLYAVRELCVKLDHTRDELTRKIAASASNQEKLEILLSDSKAETGALKKEILKEKEASNSLESIISTHREKQFFDRKYLQENLEDLQRVKEQLSKCEQEKVNKTKESDRLHEHQAKLEEHVTLLQRQLTSQVFHQEVLHRDMREKNKSPMTASSQLDSSAPIKTVQFKTQNTSSLQTDAPFSPLNVSFSSDSGKDT